MPPVDEITPEIIAYWQERARAARQPQLQIRYADLAWEFGRRAKLAVDVALPRTVIDATVAAAAKRLFKHSTVGFTGLKRALALALSLRDDGRGCLWSYRRRARSSSVKRPRPSRGFNESSHSPTVFAG